MPRRPSVKQFARTARREIGRRLPYRWYEGTLSDAFHSLFYRQRHRTWENTRWLGTIIEKFPGDLIVYQEILFETRPDIIVETGTAYGGSALFLASICDLIGHGEVVTIDMTSPRARPAHPRITYLEGSSVAPDTLAEVEARAQGTSSRLIILDSDHSYDHVCAELRCYADFVTPGGYLIVEDTNQSGHPVGDPTTRGPWEAVTDFLATRRDFEADRAREKFFVTANPRGYLRRLPPSRVT